MLHARNSRRQMLVLGGTERNGPFRVTYQIDLSISASTGKRVIAGTWFREILFCFCFPVLPCFVWKFHQSSNTLVNLILYPQFDTGAHPLPYSVHRAYRGPKVEATLSNSIQSFLLLEADGKRMERKQHLHPFLALRFAKRVHVEEATR